MGNGRVEFVFAPNAETGQITLTVEIGSKGAQRETTQPRRSNYPEAFHTAFSGYHQDGSLAFGGYGRSFDSQTTDSAGIPEDLQLSTDTQRAPSSQAVMDQPSKTRHYTVGEPRQTSVDGTLPDRANGLGQPAHPFERHSPDEMHDKWNSASACSSPTGSENSEDGEGISTGSKAPPHRVSPAFDRPFLLPSSD